VSVHLAIMPECSSGTYCFCPARKLKRQHPCKVCGRFLHGGPCVFYDEGGFGLPNVFYCVKCFHSENVEDEATPTIRFAPPVPPTPVQQQQQQQQQQQISNERRQSPNSRQHSSCLSARCNQDIQSFGGCTSSSDHPFLRTMKICS
jgi:hypothetical protein